MKLDTFRIDSNKAIPRSKRHSTVKTSIPTDLRMKVERTARSLNAGDSFFVPSNSLDIGSFQNRMSTILNNISTGAFSTRQIVEASKPGVRIYARQTA